jgi:hypothetical protein
VNTVELRNNGGTLTGFSVSNLLLRRGAVPKIVRKIPGARIVRHQRPFRLSGPDDFCEFELDGRTFLVIEPFGDNSRYLVVTEPFGDSPQLAMVRDAFARHRVLFGLLAG